MWYILVSSSRHAGRPELFISKANMYIQIKCTANDTVHFFFDKDFPHADFIIMLITSLFLH